MKLHWYSGLIAGFALLAAAHAQEPVVAAQDTDALFHSSDPKLNANKQVVYHLMKDVMEAGHAELADKYLTTRYIQHNPMIASGRDSFLKVMSQFRKPRPIADKLETHVVSVVAEGDTVMVAHALVLPDPRNPGKTYTATGFDMWRIKDGKADEHWDGATLGGPMPPPPGPGTPPGASAPR